MDIERSSLGRLEELGQGRYGIVYATPDLTLPDIPGPLVVKLFVANAQSKPESERLRRLVGWRDSLDPATRSELDSLCTWPVRIIVEGRRIVGVVMVRAPERFFYDFVPVAAGHAPRRKPMTVQFLIDGAAKTRNEGIAAPDDDDVVTRLITCARIAQFIRLMHANGMVYGDLSQGNVLTSAEPKPPAVLTVDCDAVYFADSRQPNHQRGTRLWFSPEEGPEGTDARLDQRTDIYKLCLVILRILVPGTKNIFQMTRASRLRGILDDPGVDLLDRGLAKDPDERPTADEVYRYMLAELDGRTSPPVITRFDVTEPFLVVGAMFDLLIDVDHATKITVRTPEGRTLDVPPAQAHSALRIAAVESGSYVLTARNTFGTVSVESPVVRVVRPPDLVAIHYPEPDIPTLDAGDMSVLRRGLEAAEATGAQLTSPFEHARRISRELSAYDGLYAPAEQVRDVMQVPDDLIPRLVPTVRQDPSMNPLRWPFEEPPKQHRPLFARLLRPQPLFRNRGTREDHR